jgi:hypothetical protein
MPQDVSFPETQPRSEPTTDTDATGDPLAAAVAIGTVGTRG